MQNPQQSLLPAGFTDPGTMAPQSPMMNTSQAARPQNNNPLYGMLGRGLFALLLLLPSSLWATTTVTGKMQNLGTGNITSGAFMRFWLRGCAGNQPRVNGTGLIAPSQGGVFFFDIAADASGNVSGTLYSTRDAAGTGNGDIECGGSQTAVWYGMQAWVAGKSGPEVAVHAKNASTLDITQVTPITTNPVITAPTGDGTYLRLDAGNSPVTGNVQVTGNLIPKVVDNVQIVDSTLSRGGIDIGNEINLAYAALPAAGGKIQIYPKSDGSCYSYSTPIVASTNNKYLLLEAAGASGASGAGAVGGCINYTPTTATSAITLDYVSNTISPLSAAHGIRNLTVINNLCTTTGGCASSAIGINTGTTNQGTYAGHFENVSIIGFGVGYKNANNLSVDVKWDNPQFFSNTVGIQFDHPTGMYFDGGTIAGNGTAVQALGASSSAAMQFSATQFFGNTVTAFDWTASSSIAQLDCLACHLENSPSGSNTHFMNGAIDATFTGGVAEDDIVGGTRDWMFTTSGKLFIEGMSFFETGTLTQIVVANAGAQGRVTGHIGSVGHFTNYITGANAGKFTVNIAENGVNQLSVQKLAIGGGTAVTTSNQSGTGNLVLATSPTLTTPILSGVTNGTGLQLFNTTTTCTTGASVGATCTTAAITLPAAEADTSYRIVCTGKGLTNVPVVIATTNSSATQFTITIAALTAAAASFTSYDCSAGHN